MGQNLLILGAGQYGAVAKEIAEQMGDFDKIDFLDDRHTAAIGKLDDADRLVCEYPCAFVAIGNADVRTTWLKRLKKIGYALPTIVSPQACVSSLARVGEGTIVEPMAVIQPHAIVGDGCLVCAGAVVKHNATVGDGCYLDCNSVVMSDVMIRAYTKIPCGVIKGKEI